MKIVKAIAVALVVITLAVIALAPIGPLPGFFIGGEPMDAPEQWPDTSDVHEVKLKVIDQIPRVVIIWVIQYQSELYVVGSRSSGWVKKLGDGGPVALRINDSTYPLTAELMQTDWQPMMLAYIDKYRADYPEIIDGFPPVEEAGDQIAVFHLVR